MSGSPPTKGRRRLGLVIRRARRAAQISQGLAPGRQRVQSCPSPSLGLGLDQGARSGQPGRLSRSAGHADRRPPTPCPARPTERHGLDEVRPLGAIQPGGAHDPGLGAQGLDRTLPRRLGSAVCRPRRERRVPGLRAVGVAGEDVVSRWTPEAFGPRQPNRPPDRRYPPRHDRLRSPPACPVSLGVRRRGAARASFAADDQAAAHRFDNTVRLHIPRGYRRERPASAKTDMRASLVPMTR